MYRTLSTFWEKYIAHAYRLYGQHGRKNSLRGWLKGIAKNKSLEVWREQRRKPPTNYPEPPPGLDMEYDDSVPWAVNTVRLAIDMISHKFHPNSMKAFKLYVLQGWPPAKVAQAMDMTQGNVFVIKTRVLKALAIQLKSMNVQEQYLEHCCA